jgi:hypothetical protein
LTVWPLFFSILVCGWKLKLTIYHFVSLLGILQFQNWEKTAYIFIFQYSFFNFAHEPHLSSTYLLKDIHYKLWFYLGCCEQKGGCY